MDRPWQAACADDPAGLAAAANAAPDLPLPAPHVLALLAPRLAATAVDLPEAW